MVVWPSNYLKLYLLLGLVMIQLVSRCIFHITEKSSLHLWSEIYMESDSSLTKAIVEKGEV